MDKKLKNSQEVLLKVYDDYFCQLADKDMEQVCLHSGSRLNNGIIEVSFFNDEYLVDIEEKIIKKKKDQKITDPYTSSIILHYLLNASGAALSGNWIAYRQLPGGLFYARTIDAELKPLADIFGKDPGSFFEKAKRLGAKRSEEFENGVIMDCFKKVPLLVIIYPEDAEFGSEAKILFDSSIPGYLKTDIVKLVILYTVKLFTR